MLVCALVAIVKDGAQGTGLYEKAWQIVDNFIIQNCNIATSSRTLISLLMVQNAIKLAQRHLEGIPGDYQEPATLTYHVDATEEDVDMDQDPVALQAHITKKQK
eukprot:3261638-Rhodomonas_salina.1